MKTLEDLEELRKKLPARAVKNDWFVSKASVFETLTKNKMYASANHVFAQLQSFTNLQAKKG